MKFLFIIDMQNDFIDGVLGSPEAQAIVPKVIEKIKQQKDVIVYTQDSHKKSNYLQTLFIWRGWLEYKTGNL